jgi:ubiquitin carboxyl-terminal hydrolase 10
MDKQTVSLLPRGLTNRSNYCYINSILQALLACPLFYNLLMALPYSKNPSRHSASPLIDNM